MQFINSQIDIQSLPAIDTISFQPLHLYYLKILRIEWLITTFVLIAIAAALLITVPNLRSFYGWLAICGTIAVVVGLYLLFQEKGFPLRGFAVRDKDVIYRYGWVIQTIKICPFNRIQNCSVQSGPLERRYGLATLTIFTAGSDGADMRIPGLLQKEADKLRHFILEKIHKEADENI